MELTTFLTLSAGKAFRKNVLESGLVEGVRWNSGAPLLEGTPVDALRKFTTTIAPVIPWIDLKGRELRLVKDATLPEDLLDINHPISVDTPTALYYNEGRNFLIVDAVIGESQLQIRPPKTRPSHPLKFGKGASINIPDASLEVHGYLTRLDEAYIAAGNKIGLHNYLLSFVESAEDIQNLVERDPDARIIAKIESKRGLEFLRREYDRQPKVWKERVRLMAARADLYIELERPHQILTALRTIIQKDPRAIGASRLLESFLSVTDVPWCADICDVGYLVELGYRTFLLGDDLCENPEALTSALGILHAIGIDNDTSHS